MWIRTYLSACALLLVVTPLSAAAQVVISEIMYDAPGTEGSGDRDWIEVFNAGNTAVDVSSYRFLEAGVNHTLKLDRGDALIPSGGYAVIANNPGMFVTEWPSFAGTLFDSSFNLSSSGENIGMRTGDLADSDPPFTYQPIDAATNNGQSLHRAAVSGTAFTAAAPTPGSGELVAEPARNEEEHQEETATTTEKSQTSTTTIAASTQVSSYVPPPVPQLFADAGEDRTVIVGADTVFSGRAYNRKQEIVENVRFSWNFGDGTLAEGSRVLHHFDYPGRYAVILSIAQMTDAASERVVITAEPARLGFTVHPDGSVAIENLSGKDLDLSRWMIRSFGRTFTLPDDSIILSGATLRMNRETLGFSVSAESELLYPNGTTALGAGEQSLTAPAAHTTQEIVAVQPTPKQVKKPIARPTPRVAIASAEAKETEPASDATPATSTQVAAAAETGIGYIWWAAAGALALLVAGAAVVAKRLQKGEWNIVDES